MALGIVFPGWSNANELRSYPLHELATQRSPDGVTLPSGIIADANIMVPESAGKFVFISSVSITPGLVSVTFLATDTDPFSPGAVAPTSFVPLAAISISKPIDLYRNYAIDPMYPGVSGWVAFGSGVDELDTFSIRFETPEASLLCSKAARSYKDYPVHSLGKLGRVTELTGLVTLQGGRGINIEKVIREISGRKREVIKIGLDLTSNATEILHTYAGDCGERPEDKTCSQGQPLLTINGVTPDCDGNVDIIFEGIDVAVTSVPAGMILDVPVGLLDVCSEFDPSRYDPIDLCEPVPSSSDSSDPSSSDSSSSVSSSSAAPAPTEYFDDFANAERTFANMIPELGTWSIKDVEPDEATVGVSRLYCVYSVDPATITVPAITRQDDPGYRTFSVIRPFTSAANGHVIFAHKGDDDFWYAGLSVDTDGTPNGKLYVGHKTGDLGSNLDDWPNGFEFGYQFDSDGEPNLDAGSGIISPTGIFGSDVRVEVFVEPVSIGNALKLVTVKWFWNRSGQGIINPLEPFNTTVFVTGFDLSGRCGVGAVGCETHFDSFGILDLT